MGEQAQERKLFLEEYFTQKTVFGLRRRTFDDLQYFCVKLRYG